MIDDMSTTFLQCAALAAAVAFFWTLALRQIGRDVARVRHAPTGRCSLGGCPDCDPRAPLIR